MSFQQKIKKNGFIFTLDYVDINDKKELTVDIKSNFENANYVFKRIQIRNNEIYVGSNVGDYSKEYRFNKDKGLLFYHEGYFNDGMCYLGRHNHGNLIEIKYPYQFSFDKEIPSYVEFSKALICTSKNVEFLENLILEFEEYHPNLNLLAYGKFPILNAIDYNKYNGKVIDYGTCEEDIEGKDILDKINSCEELRLEHKKKQRKM